MDRRDSPRAPVIPITNAPSAPHPGTVPQPTRSSGHGRVGVVLVSHSQELAAATAALAVALAGTDDPSPVAATGGNLADGLGTSAVLIAAAARRVDQGHGVAILADLGGAVTTVRTLLAEAEEHGIPSPVRFANAPFVEGAVAAVVTASAGGDLAAVLDAAEEAYRQHKL